MNWLSKYGRPLGAVALALALAAPSAAGAAEKEITVGFVNAMSGPNAALGLPYERGLKVAEALSPEINGHKVRVITLDDASDPSKSERETRKLITEDHVDVLIGTVGVPNVMAMASVATQLKTPQISPSPTSKATTDPATQWTVSIEQPFDLMIGAAVEQMHKDGVRTAGYIGFSDALGDLTLEDLKDGAKKYGIQVLTDQRYARSDTSVTGQILRILALKPDAVFTGTSGSAGALPLLELAKRGYKGRVYGTHGLVNNAFVKVVGSAGNGVEVPAGPVVVAEQLEASNPIRAISLEFLDNYRKLYHSEPEGLFESYGYDAYRLFADAAKRAKGEPGTAEYRQSLRAAILSTNGLVQTNGVLNFKPGDYYGYTNDERAVVMVRLENGQWQLIH